MLMAFPINLRINGEYEDVYLYKGRLYLWPVDGTCLVVKWNKLIESLSGDNPLSNSLLNWSFSNNKFVLSQELRSLLTSSEIYSTFTEHLTHLNNRSIAIDPSYLDRFAIAKVDAHIEDMTDVLFYNDKIYLSSINGTFGAQMETAFDKTGSESPFGKLVEAYTVHLSAKYDTVNSACCDDGLFCSATLNQYRETRTLYHSDKFTRLTSWTGRDFLTVGEDNFSYFVNKFPTSDRASKAVAEVSRGARQKSGTSATNSNRIEKFGDKVLEGSSLIKGINGQFKIQYLFSLNSYIFACVQEGNRFHVLRWKTKIKRGQFEGLKEDARIDELATEVFRCYALNNNLIVLDTINGTMVVNGDAQPFILADDLNVSLRTFPDSHWYQTLICSVKEDYILISSIWPLERLA